MSFNCILALINKIDGYITDITLSNEVLPFGSLGMKVDVILNYIIYGTSFSEYFAYRFYAKSHIEKRNYMTRRHMFRFFDRYNPIALRERIGDKRLTHLYYGEFMKRDQFDYKCGLDEFIKFTEIHPKLFIKRAISWGGGRSIYCRCIYTSKSG